MATLRPKLPTTPCECGSHYCYYCRRLASDRAYRQRHARPRQPKVFSTNSRAITMRALRERRLRAGLDAVWMIGYDGPSETPVSVWPAMAEHAALFGL
jgi:hypothetical protein